MILKPLTPKQTLNKAYLKEKVLRSDIEKFKSNLLNLLNNIDHEESEENVKNHLKDFLNDTYYKNKYLLNTKGNIDLAVYLENKQESSVGVLFEVKKPDNKSDMLTKADLNAKALHQLALYYIQERIESKNNDIKFLIATNIYEWFIFDAGVFEDLFLKNKSLVKNYERWEAKQKVKSNTDHFYNEIAKPFLDTLEKEITFTYFNFEDYVKDKNKDDDKKLIALYKLLSPVYLLKLPFANDSNSLDKNFYNELLHLIGLEEIKVKNKKLIQRKEESERNPGSLIENAIQILETDIRIDKINSAEKYGAAKDEQIYNVALELCITWVNRILFLKLLEAQLYKYHHDDKFKFLNSKTIVDYDALYKLFHHVLAVPFDKRKGSLKEKFELIPYLNSSLFEISDLEDETIKINSLDHNIPLEIYSSSVLKDKFGKKRTGSIPSLYYFFEFLEAYDFTSEGKEDFLEDNKTLINASVLGLIFEKINGYKDGSYFTPGFITMYMSRETIRRAVVQKFNEKYKWDCNSFDDLKNHLASKQNTLDILEFNTVINSLKICDPAVGSGHFLVSALNEIISIKSELGILVGDKGVLLNGYDVKIENDELIITTNNGEDIFEYHPSIGGEVNNTHRIQRTFFHEKQTIIENCLFGVDINPNSVKIARLRLWIELLKNAYYEVPSLTSSSSSPIHHQAQRHPGLDLGSKFSNMSKEGHVQAMRSELVTLPNIDINIKEGNSLINRFSLSDDYSKLSINIKNNMKFAAQKYKDQVFIYKSTSDKETRNKAAQEIKNLKKLFSEFANPTDKDYLLLKKKETELGEIPLLFDRKEKEEHDKKIEKLAAEVNDLKNKYEEKQKTIYGNAFEWRFEFPEVLDDEGRFVGFDVVIGNPPYGRYLSINDQQKEKLKELNIYGSTGDIAEFFINRMIKHIIREKTQFSFIIPKGLSYVSSWENIRERFLDEFNIYSFIDTSKAFDEALYEMLIFHVEVAKKKFPQVKCGYLSKEREDIFQLNRNYYNKRIFYLGFPKNYLSILEKITSNSKPVKNLMNFWYGKGGLTPSINKQGKGIQLLTGKEILQYGFKQDIDKWFIEKKYLDDDDLDKKELEKVVVQDIVAHIMNPFPHIKITAALDTEKRFPLNTVMNFSENKSGLKNKTLLAVLNSRFISFYYYYFIFNQAIRTMHFMPGYADELPIPDNILRQQEPLIDLVNKIFKKKILDPHTDTTALEKEIDQIVYKLYGLTEEEIKIVEGI
ncbi:MAG: hypothetical protein M1480_12990 [Bacteroidetes bacterium]|nr:hypothetical protein [Bacteroidota bacterium]